MNQTKSQDDKDVELQPLAPQKASTVSGGTAKPGAAGGKGKDKAILSCALYCFCSISMVLVNKSLASSYNDLIQGDLNVLLVVFQAIIAVIAVETCKKMKWVEYPTFNMRTARQWAPVNIMFCLMLFTGMASLQVNSVPMVTIFKNITNIFCSFGDYYFFGSTVDRFVILSFSVMLLGALLAAGSDFEMNPVGIFWMISNCFATAGYILYMKYATKNVKLTKFGMVFYNNVLCILFLLPVATINGELLTFLRTNAIHSFDYFWKNGFAGFVGFFLNFASLNCVANTGPTTYAIVGSLNKIPITFLGYFMFHDTVSPDKWKFIAFSMSGGFLYSYAKIRSSRLRAKQTHLG
uniref:Sugar phosphate transporter domain-containing protein n=1 Tax=Eucampia antarctica TaxID=49252 RepID=A0A7S2R176_9STRA|mmetsp:Transcript_12953/g.12584  ORF Transcript_12953/g.12584 Transcript_12953/m.12584 type:complete len:350 (+) Transcript_12953:189-1238(+)